MRWPAQGPSSSPRGLLAQTPSFGSALSFQPHSSQHRPRLVTLTVTSQTLSPLSCFPITLDGCSGSQRLPSSPSQSLPCHLEGPGPEQSADTGVGGSRQPRLFRGAASLLPACAGVLAVPAWHRSPPSWSSIRLSLKASPASKDLSSVCLPRGWACVWPLLCLLCPVQGPGTSSCQNPKRASGLEAPCILSASQENTGIRTVWGWGLR